VGDLIAEISTASSEQRSEIERVNDAIAGLKSVTHQNAGLVQNAADSAQALQDVALRLDHGVSIFKLAGDARAAGAIASLPAHASTGSPT
jgi:methyl-accepting chemotaxis protein